MPRQYDAGLQWDDHSLGTMQIQTPGIGVGCDFFPSLNLGRMRVTAAPNVHMFDLNRDATIYVIQRNNEANAAAWITAGDPVAQAEIKRLSNGSVSAYDVYEFEGHAGMNDFPGAWDVGSTPSGARQMPVFIFCENDGSATLTPPGNIQPNAPCPSSLHDQWVTTGPDGQTYATWHPEIDETYWCYYGHEHGSNPAHFDANWHPAFGYTATQHGMSEAHAGFKVYVFDDDTGQYRHAIVQHQGSSGTARACVSHHTLEYRMKDLSSGSVLVDVKFMADFGKAINNNSQLPYTPTACPNQAANATGTGVRQIALVGGTNYGPWRADFVRVGSGPVVFLGGSFTFNTPDDVADCADMTCDTVVASGDSGTQRFITANDGFAFVDPVSGSNNGSFCTNPEGTAVVACNTAGAIAQFVADGLNFVPDIAKGGADGHLVDQHSFGAMYEHLTHTPPATERENSIPTGGPN